MGLWDRLPGRTPKKRGRGKAKDPEAKLKLLNAKIQTQAIEQMMKRNPDALYEQAIKRLGLTGTEDKELTLEQLNKISNLIKPLGLKIVPSKGGGDEGGSASVSDVLNSEFAVGIAPGIGPGLGALLSGLAKQMGFSPPIQEAPRITTVSEQPLQSQAPTQQIEEAESEEEEQPLSLQVSYAIGQLKGKAPPDAARWILGLPFPEVRNLAQQLYNTPDEQLPNLLVKIEQQAPDYRPLVAFLRSDPKWFMETVHAIRDIVGANQPEAQPAKVKKKIMGF